VSGRSLWMILIVGLMFVLVKFLFFDCPCEFIFVLCYMVFFWVLG